MSLLQNADRPLWKLAGAVGAGMAAGSGCDPLGPEWGDALTRTPEEAARLLARLNGERAYRRARAEREG